MDKFTDRLQEYRLNEGFYKKGAFARCLRVSEQLYSSVETGYKKPSKDFIAKLVHYTDKPAIYWLYGVDQEEEFSKLKEVLTELPAEEIFKIGCVDCRQEVLTEITEAFLKDIRKFALKKSHLLK